MNLARRDKKLIWHPFTQEMTANLPLPITKGKGAYLYDENGRKYLDLISSWWVNLHGHANPKIANAIHRQARKLEHVIFAGFTHEPAVRLCEKLKTILHPSLNRFFFSDNGSTAVEVALKMTYQFWRNQGDYRRNIFLSFDGGYHGDTFGAMSVGKACGFHDHFEKLFFKAKTIPYPSTWDGDQKIEEKENKAIQSLEFFLKKHANQTVAFIAEPLIQGASGMRVCRASFLREVVDRIRAYRIPVIFDEIMTDFGRTGTTFSYEQVKRAPDILCLSKGLTGGFLPLALTITSEKIYRAFLGKDFSKALAHGHSYTAHPLGCAAACASLEILLEKKTQKHIRQIYHLHRDWLSQLSRNNSDIVAPRVLGTIAAFNLKNPQTNYSHPLGAILKKKFLKQNLLLRPLGNTIYFLPPYCITLKDLDKAYRTVEKILKSL